MQYIYFIECQGFVKIGIATNINSRLSGIQTGNPFKINLLCLIPECLDFEGSLEKKFHRFFHKFRTKGEWFKLPEDIIKKLKDIDEDGISLTDIETFDLSQYYANKDYDGRNAWDIKVGKEEIVKIVW